jgi:cytochrome c2
MKLLAGLLFSLLALSACKPAARPGADPRAGAVLITRYACGSCHAISGVEEADGMVGPSLQHLAGQKMVAGVLPNTPSNVARFVRTPRAFVKDSVMPDQALTDAEARDVAAYLETLQ